MSASVIKVGCAELPDGMSRQNYFAQFSFLETRISVGGIPSEKALRKWRKECGDASIAYVAPAGLWGDATEDWVELIAAQRAVLQADALLFETPADFTPSQHNRDRLARVADALRVDGVALVWFAGGLWEPEQAIAAAERMGMIWGCDPLSSDPMREDPDFFYKLPFAQVYWRLEGRQAGKRLDIYDRETLIGLCEEYDAAWISFTGRMRYKNAQALAKDVTAAE